MIASNSFFFLSFLFYVCYFLSYFVVLLSFYNYLITCKFKMVHYLRFFSLFSLKTNFTWKKSRLESILIRRKENELIELVVKRENKRQKGTSEIIELCGWLTVAQNLFLYGAVKFLRYFSTLIRIRDRIEWNYHGDK